ncbi:hypothetical protein, partial [Proteus mirabilis]|uniref:hypothetical protein n=1 Tax=Proteus mirabilis TaxID=584 RepID=UPI001D02BD86
FNVDYFLINKKINIHVNLLINHLVNFIYNTFFPGVVLFFALFPQQGFFLSLFFILLVITQSFL